VSLTPVVPEAAVRNFYTDRILSGLAELLTGLDD